jgi:hypothetical protein
MKLDTFNRNTENILREYLRLHVELTTADLNELLRHLASGDTS